MTEYVFLSGKTKWFRHAQTNQWNKWSHVLYPNSESVEKIRELQSRGVKNVLGKDEDGYRITLSRPQSITVRGKPLAMKPPEIFTADGVTPLRAMNVGNGSDVTTKVEVYQYNVPQSSGKKGLAMRWFSSRIDNLVPFESSRDFNKEEVEAAAGLAEQPPQPPF